MQSLSPKSLPPHYNRVSKSKVLCLIFGTLIISFMKPIVFNEFKYWDSQEIIPSVITNYAIIIMLTIASLIVMKIVSSATSKEYISWAILFFQSWVIAIVLFVLLMIISKTKDDKESFTQNELTVISKDSVDYFDKSSNIYSNYKYGVAFRSPAGWARDNGVTSHMIFRAVKPDSLYTFTINVIETKHDVEKIFLKEYTSKKGFYDKSSKDGIERQLNTKTKEYITGLTYIRNRPTIKTYYTFIAKDQDIEVEMAVITEQTAIGNLTYTFGLSVPLIYYIENTNYLNNMFSRLYFIPKNKQ